MAWSMKNWSGCGSLQRLDFSLYEVAVSVAAIFSPSLIWSAITAYQTAKYGVSLLRLFHSLCDYRKNNALALVLVNGRKFLLAKLVPSIHSTFLCIKSRAITCIQGWCRRSPHSAQYPKNYALFQVVP